LETDCTYINYEQTNSFAELVYDYINVKNTIKPFIRFEPNQSGINAAIETRKQYPINREVLVLALKRQYKAITSHPIVNQNIEALRNNNTFSICTAHQPNLATGYLYFFYKILHAIKLAEVLNLEHPEKHFVPVYYMGSEDNDLDELGQFWYEGKKHKWDAEGQTGAVGRMSSKSLNSLFKNLFKTFGPPGKHCEELIEMLSESYLQQETIAEATHFLVHQLFGHYGLLVLNPDDADLKALFSDIVNDELFHQNAFPIVSQQSSLLAEKYKAQAFPRPINLFYLKDDLRERIEKNGDTWTVVNTDIHFTEQELKSELKNHPERFSPNVILRGLFQESILPNICFIGGGSEVAYWLQLKPVFDFYKVFFPVVILRQSVQIINEDAWQLAKRLGVSLTEIFQAEESLTKIILGRKTNLSWQLQNEKEIIHKTMEAIAQKAYAVDPTLEKSAQAALTKMQKQLSIIEQKIYRAEKRKEHELVAQIKRLKAAIQPNGGLQERVENFMPYYLQDGFAIFENIKNNLKPLGNQFLIIHPKK